GCPLQRSAEAPWIVNFNLLAVTVGNPHVPEEWNNRCTQDECEHGRNLVHGGEPVFWHVVSVTTWHTHDAQPVLDQEGAVEADEQQPEVDLAKALVEHLASPLWPPEVEASEHCEYHGAEDYIVEVSNHEVGIRNVEVQDRSRQDNTGQATAQEGDHEAHAPEHWGFKRDRAAPQGTDPVEELHTGWNCDQHGHEAEERQHYRAGDVHVVCPHGNRQCSNRDGSEDQALVAEDRLAGEHWED